MLAFTTLQNSGDGKRNKVENHLPWASWGARHETIAL